MAQAIGISKETYRPLERGEMETPRLWYLVNAAAAAGRARAVRAMLS